MFIPQHQYIQPQNPEKNIKKGLSGFDSKKCNNGIPEYTGLNPVTKRFFPAWTFKLLLLKNTGILFLASPIIDKHSFRIPAPDMPLPMMRSPALYPASEKITVNSPLHFIPGKTFKAITEKMVDFYRKTF